MITLHKSLDRDLPYGHAEYQFNVLVVDEPNTESALVGYAYVKIKPQDINDKVPEFRGDLTGFVPENSEKGLNCKKYYVLCFISLLQHMYGTQITSLLVSTKCLL